MLRIFMIILVIFTAIPVFAQKTVVSRTPYYNSYSVPQNSYYNTYPQNQYSDLFSDINELEMYAMNRCYPNLTNFERIQRLEELAFGAVQEGDIYARYQNVRQAILSQPKQNYKTSLLRSLGNYFIGQTTGYTPQLNQYYGQNYYEKSYLPNNYTNSSFVNYSGPYGQGYRYNNRNNGVSSSIRILD